MDFYGTLRVLVSKYRKNWRWKEYHLDEYEVDDAFVAYHILKVVVQTQGSENIGYEKGKRGEFYTTLLDSDPMSEIFSTMEGRLEKLADELEGGEFWEFFSEDYNFSFDYEIFRETVSNLHEVDENIALTNINQYRDVIMQEYEKIFTEKVSRP